MGVGGKRSAMSFHKELGDIMWENCGMARTKRRAQVRFQEESREEFWQIKLQAKQITTTRACRESCRFP